MELFFMCLKIFLARIVDVSLGTVRTIMVVKGKNVYAALVGFLEVTIWFLIVKDALNNDFNSPWIVISYAAGFASGTCLGGLISSRFIKSKLNVQIIIDSEKNDLINILRDNGFAVSVVSAKGYNDSNKLLLLVEIDNTRLEVLEELVKNYDKKAFIIVNETKYVQNGYFRSIAK